MVDRFLVFEAAGAQGGGRIEGRRHGRSSRYDGVSDAGGGLIMTAVGTLRGEWSASSLRAGRRSRWPISRLSVQSAGSSPTCTHSALASVVRVAVRLHHPVIAVALGVLLHEPFTWRMAIAAGLVFVGVSLVRLAQRPGPGGRLIEPVERFGRARESRSRQLKRRTSPERRLSRTISGRGFSTRGRGG